MKTNQPLISFLVATNEGPEDILRCLGSILVQSYSNIEIIVLDDNSGHGICGEVAGKYDDPRIRCITSGKPLGVAGGRNVLIKKAKGDILITLDDDAAFRFDNSIEQITHVFNTFPDVGLIAFKIVDIDGHHEKKVRVPFRRAVVKKNPDIVDMSQYVSYYLGGGHAARKKVYEDCGLYQEDLFFGAEELDLSYRIIEKGYSILYCPDIFIEHYPHLNSLNRVRSGYMYYSIRNKIWINYKYLPALPFVINTCFWSLVLLAASIRKGEFIAAIKGVLAGFGGFKRLKRTVISDRTIQYLRRNYGRVYI